MSSYRRHFSLNKCGICISSIGYQTELYNILIYFERFGLIHHYNFTGSSGGGLVFITYENRSSVDRCMSNRPHRIDGHYLYVKRAIPFNSDYPREHIDSARDLMIIIDSINYDEKLLKNLSEYFSLYGKLYACKICHETNFDYVLIEFADYDQIDRIILDKPHYLNEHPLSVMKSISTNRCLMNMKYLSKTNLSSHKNDIETFLKFQLDYKKKISEKSYDCNDEIDLKNEVFRLQNVLKQTQDDFSIKRKQLEDDCCEQLRKLNKSADKIHRLQQDLEQEYEKLLMEYESLKNENKLLNEEYIMIELENFEITSYYEQILNEEKVQTIQYENDSSPQPSAISDDD